MTPFLSSSYRFQGLSEANENPGPGAYHNTDEKVKMILEGDDKIKNIMDAENEKKQNHYFKSNSKRAGFMNRANCRNELLISGDSTSGSVQSEPI